MTHFDYSPRYNCTHLCFSLGMWYSYYRHDIEMFLQRNISYYFSTIVTGFLMLFFAYIVVKYLSIYPYLNIFLYNIIAMLFSLFIVFLTMKVTFHSQILVLIGKQSFWVYILQRLPMNLFLYLQINEMSYLFLFLTIFCLVILVAIISQISLYLKNKIILK